MRVVGHYEIGETLGRGGSAVVYLARDLDNGREVALKELWLGGPMQDPDAVRRFVREAQVGADLRHPNIVAVDESFEHEGTPYIAMEYLRRGSLRPRVGHVTVAQLFGVLEGLLAALDCAEQRGIVHRDLKPENLLVSDTGAVKVADFGIAKGGPADAFATITATGTTLGTPQYMAPEQALGRRLTPAADLYSAGIIAYELLVGFTPFFDIEEPMAVMQSHINHAIAPAVTVDAGVDPALSAWIDALLRKDPAQRPPSAAAAWNELEMVAIGLLGRDWRDGARLVDAAGPLTPAPFSAADGARTARLEVPTPPVVPAVLRRPPSRRRRVRLPARSALAMVAVAAVAAVAAREVFKGGDDAGGAAPPRVTDIISLGGQRPDGIAVGANAVWVVTQGKERLLRIDPGTHRVTAAVPTGADPDSVVTDGGSVYVTAQGRGQLIRYDTQPRLAQFSVQRIGPAPEGMAVGDEYVWVALSGADEVQRVDRDTGKPVGKRVGVGDTPIGIDVNQHKLWTANAGDGTVSLRRQGELPRAIPVGRNPRDVLEAFGYAWVVLTGEDAVVRIDAETGARVGPPIKVGHLPHKIAATDTALWVTNAADGTVSEIDPRTAREVARVHVGKRPVGIAAGEGAVWVANDGNGTVSRIEPGA